MTACADWFETSNDATKILLQLVQRPEITSLAGGLPAAEIFPAVAVADAFTKVIREQPAQALQYGRTEGVDALRELVAERLNGEGLPVGPENILITTGSLQGLVMVGQTLLNPGDGVALDEPTFLGALDAWRPATPTYSPIDWSGALPAFGTPGAAKPKFAYALPNFRNPTGETMPLSQRQALVDAAARDGVIVLEDNPYGALRYEGTQPDALLTLSARKAGEPGTYDGDVIYTGTVSKTLAPALRLGWIAAPARLIDALTIAKQGLDLCTSPLTQYAAVELIRSGVEDETSDAARVLYKGRRDAMLDAMDRFMPEGVRWTRPEGGMFIWVTLPDGLDSATVFQAAADAGVGIVPGTVFYAMEPATNTIRLNFTNVAEDKIRAAVETLGGVLYAMHREAA